MSRLELDLTATSLAYGDGSLWVAGTDLSGDGVILQIHPGRLLGQGVRLCPA
jgi:hypothetical protein